MRNEQLAEAQQVLDELLKEQLIPFKLRVGTILDQGLSEYRVRFFDSRIRSADFPWSEGESFPEIFRLAVLDRVARMSGRLHTKPA